MSLRIGDEAPNFQVKTTEGQIDYHQWIGNGYAVLGNADTSTFVDRLVAMTVAERRALPYMHPGRVDVIGGGALVWQEVLDRALALARARGN